MWSHRKFLVEAETLDNGNMLLTDRDGISFPVKKSHFEDNYVQVEVKKDKHKIDHEEMGKMYASVNEWLSETVEDELHK